MELGGGIPIQRHVPTSSKSTPDIHTKVWPFLGKTFPFSLPMTNNYWLGNGYLQIYYGKQNRVLFGKLPNHCLMTVEDWGLAHYFGWKDYSTAPCVNLGWCVAAQAQFTFMSKSGCKLDCRTVLPVCVAVCLCSIYKFCLFYSAHQAEIAFLLVVRPSVIPTFWPVLQWRFSWFPRAHCKLLPVSTMSGTSEDACWSIYTESQYQKSTLE